MKSKRFGEIEYVESSGNIFADIGIPNPEEALIKAGITSKIQDVITEKRLTQTKAAKIIGLSKSKLSLLLRGHFTDFPLEQLLRFLNYLGQDVYISIVPSPGLERGRTIVQDAPSCARVAALGK